ncbi:MAG: hypothetical protein JST32_22930 [Bacteroidetes bacterium]|nr:hypothetical protein [Bacteroidota bacterium]
MGAAFEKDGSVESDTVDTQELYAQIGQLKVENEFLKKGSRNLAGSGSGTLNKFAGKKNISPQAMRITKREQKPVVLQACA